MIASHGRGIGHAPSPSANTVINLFNLCSLGWIIARFLMLMMPNSHHYVVYYASALLGAIDGFAVLKQLIVCAQKLITN